VIVLALVVALSQPVADDQQGPPGDCEIRTWRDAFNNDAYASLTLMLRGPKGPLPINLVVTAVRLARTARTRPPAVTLDFTMPLFAGQFDLRPPHVQFVVDRKLEGEVSMTGSIEPSAVVQNVTQVTIPFEQASLGRLARATTIDGRLLGVDFVLAEKQVRAIKDFYRTHGGTP